MKTYWVEYAYTYEIFIDGEWETEKDFDAGRFTCKKADIRKEVEKRIKDDLQYEKYRNLEFQITDRYETTDCEI